MVMKAVELYSTKVFIEGYPKSRHANYKYILLEGEKEIQYLERRLVLPCYGIEIIRDDVDESNVYSAKSDRIECMTTHRYKVVQLIKKLYEGCVSPVHLIDIAGPIADEWVSDFDDEINRLIAL